MQWVRSSSGCTFGFNAYCSSGSCLSVYSDRVHSLSSWWVFSIKWELVMKGMQAIWCCSSHAEMEIMANLGKLRCCLLHLWNLSQSVLSLIQWVPWVRSSKWLSWWLCIIRCSPKFRSKSGLDVIVPKQGPDFLFSVKVFFLISEFCVCLPLLWPKWVLLPPGLAGASCTLFSLLLVRFWFPSIWLSSRFSLFMCCLSRLFSLPSDYLLHFVLSLWFSCLSCNIIPIFPHPLVSSDDN